MTGGSDGGRSAEPGSPPGAGATVVVGPSGGATAGDVAAGVVAAVPAAVAGGAATAGGCGVRVDLVGTTTPPPDADTGPDGPARPLVGGRNGGTTTEITGISGATWSVAGDGTVTAGQRSPACGGICAGPKPSPRGDAGAQSRHPRGGHDALINMAACAAVGPRTLTTTARTITMLRCGIAVRRRAASA